MRRFELVGVQRARDGLAADDERALPPIPTRRALLTSVWIEKNAKRLAVDDVRDDTLANESTVKGVHGKRVNESMCGDAFAWDRRARQIS